MELTYSAMREKLRAYFKQHFGVIAVILFVFVAGVASGVRIMQSMYSEQAQHILRLLPGVLRAQGVPWLEYFLLSLFSQVFTACLLLLGGLWLPTAVLWVVGILFRGMLLGAAMGACAAAWPLKTAVILLFMLLLEAAVLLPPFIRLGVLAQGQMADVLRKKLAGASTQPAHQEFANLYMRAAAGLLPAVALQSVFTPAVLALFC